MKSGEGGGKNPTLSLYIFLLRFVMKDGNSPGSLFFKKEKKKTDILFKSNSEEVTI